MFTFTKPSDYCSFTIVLDTLPDGYGISQVTQFVVPSKTSHSVPLSAIANATATRANGEIVAQVFNAVGDLILTETEIIPSTGVYSMSNLV